MKEEMFTCKLTNLTLYSPDVLSHAVKVCNMHKKLERLKPTLAMLGYTLSSATEALRSPATERHRCGRPPGTGGRERVAHKAQRNAQGDAQATP